MCMNNVIKNNVSKISQGTAVTAYSQGEQSYKLFMSNFLRILHTETINIS